MSLRERIAKILVLAGAVTAVACFCAADSRGRADTIYVRAGDRDIAVYQDDTGAYLFLPSGVSGEELRYSREAEELAPEICQSANLPALFISTASGNLDGVYADREYRETGKIRAYDSGGNLVYAGGLEGIKGRGNYSWNTEEWEKKSFSVRIDKNVSLLGQPAGGRFALLANASDDTLMRNDIGRALQVCMGMRYARRGIFTDLYINGGYMGVYYLCASVDTGEDRIDISTRDPGGEGGFLIEREFAERYELEMAKRSAGFVTSRREHFVIHDPGYAAQEEIDAVRAFVEQAETAILSPDMPYEDYVDKASFARTYLTEELLKNYDGGVSSAYYYRDDRADGRLFAAPGWDYDMSLGSYLEWMDEDPGQELRMYPYEGGSIWFKALYEREDFRNEVTDLYHRYREEFARILNCEGPENSPLGEASYRMEYLRWRSMYDGRGRIPGSEEAFQLLTGFGRTRMLFLDTIWITG